MLYYIIYSGSVIQKGNAVLQKLTCGKVENKFRRQKPGPDDGLTLTRE